MKPTRSPYLAGKLAVVLLFACSGAVALAAESGAPREFSSRYSFYIDGISAGETSRYLNRLDNGNYRFVTEMRLTGLAAWIRDDEAHEESIWELRNAVIRPLGYSYHRSGGSKQRNVKIRFDWERQTILNTVEGHTWKMPGGENVYDKLLYQLALMRDLDASPTELSYQVADGGHIKNYRFRVGPEETVKTPLGEMLATRVERIRDNDKRSTIMWCAKEIGFLPVRIEHSKKGGHRTTLLLEEYSW